MIPANNSRNMSISLPTLAAIQRRRRELLAYQATRQAQAPAEHEAPLASPPDDPLAAERSSAVEEARLAQNKQAAHALEFQEPQDNADHEGHQDPEEPYPPADPGPSSTASVASLTLAEPALYGLAGLAVRSLALHTEADPAAILLQFLAAFGNLIGPVPHCTVGSTRHGLNLFVVLVGESSKARKGTSWRQISSLFAEADPGWVAQRVTSVRPTAQGILLALRDQQPTSDRRLFFLTEEFASVLQVLGQRTGQLSPLLRCAWDGGDLSAHNGSHLLHAKGAHLSLVAHITEGELAHHLSRTESHNGFANRCLWTSVRRSQFLPDGGALPADQLSALARELRRALEWTQNQNELLFQRTPAARALWHDRYPALSQGRPDVYGAATSRAEAQVLRLSAIYAALDCSPVVDAPHLHAALAVWDYCQASARLFFDTAPIDPTARRINEALGTAPQGLSKAQINALFHGHVNKERIDLALQQLSSLGFIAKRTEAGRGRPSTLWAASGNTKAAGGGT
jgi:hypothetical protein